MKIEHDGDSIECVRSLSDRGQVHIPSSHGKFGCGVNFPAAQAREFFAAGLKLCDEIDGQANVKSTYDGAEKAWDAAREAEHMGDAATAKFRTVASLYEQPEERTFKVGDHMICLNYGRSDEYVIHQVYGVNKLALVGISSGLVWREPVDRPQGTDVMADATAAELRTVVDERHALSSQWLLPDGTPLFPDKPGKLAVGMRVRRYDGSVIFRLIYIGRHVYALCETNWTASANIIVEDKNDITEREASKILGDKLPDWLIVEDG